MLDAFLISSCCKSVSIFPFWPTASSRVMFSVVVSCCISLCVSPLYQILLIGIPLICVPLHPFPFAFHSFFVDVCSQDCVRQGRVQQWGAIDGVQVKHSSIHLRHRLSGKGSRTSRVCHPLQHLRQVSPVRGGCTSSFQSIWLCGILDNVMQRNAPEGSCLDLAI
jgi:hypothetical protein